MKTNFDVIFRRLMFGGAIKIDCWRTRHDGACIDSISVLQLLLPAKNNIFVANRAAELLENMTNH